VKTQRIGTGKFTSAIVKANVGQTIQYQIVVANTGDVPLVIAFADSRCDAGTLRPSGTQTVAPATSITYTCSHVLKRSDGTRFTNTATASGTTPRGRAVAPVTTSVTVTTGKPKVVKKPRTNHPHRPGHQATPARPVKGHAHFTG
jgi:hypothetical protein